MDKKAILLDYIKAIKELTDELQAHAKQVSSDKYGCQEMLIKNAWSNLEVLRQDYFPEFDYSKALFVNKVQV